MSSLKNNIIFFAARIRSMKWIRICRNETDPQHWKWYLIDVKEGDGECYLFTWGDGLRAEMGFGTTRAGTGVCKKSMLIMEHVKKSRENCGHVHRDLLQKKSRQFPIHTKMQNIRIHKQLKILTFSIRRPRISIAWFSVDPILTFSMRKGATHLHYLVWRRSYLDVLCEEGGHASPLPCLA